MFNNVSFVTPQKTCTDSSMSCPSRLSFKEAIKQAEEQIEIDAINSAYKDQARELCFIMAEVYLMNPDMPIKISGEFLEGYLVQQVFREISCVHVVLVIENFNKNTYLIKNKKAYLRASLYNSVFECEAHYRNLVNHDFKFEG